MEGPSRSRDDLLGAPTVSSSGVRAAAPGKVRRSTAPRCRPFRIVPSARHSLPKANGVSWIASLELDPSFHNVSRIVRRVLERHPGAEHSRLREAFREWVLGAAELWGIREEVLEEVKSLKEAEMIYAGVEELKEQYRERRKRARMEGRRKDRATMVCRQARLKFGAETAEQLSRLMEGIADPERTRRRTQSPTCNTTSTKFCGPER